MFSYVVDDDLQLAIPRPALDAGPLYTLIAADRATFERYLPWVKTLKRHPMNRLH